MRTSNDNAWHYAKQWFESFSEFAREAFMPQFKVGDAVRVKAGSPCSLWNGYDHNHMKGKKLTVVHYCHDETDDRVHVIGGHAECPKTENVSNTCHLEPWNDTEEWNGTAWVAKKKSEPKPAIVGKRYNSNFDFYESTNAAVKGAERRAAASPGEEFVVYQEKASFKVEKQSPAERFAEEMLTLADQIELIGGGKTVARANCVSAKADGDLVTLTYKIKE